jgi:hypothetical protein
LLTIGSGTSKNGEHQWCLIFISSGYMDHRVMMTACKANKAKIVLSVGSFRLPRKYSDHLFI